jgi:threonine aldolase
VGDDAYGEDPTVNELEAVFAPATVRLVTHHDVDDADVERAAKVITSSP